MIHSLKHKKIIPILILSLSLAFTHTLNAANDDPGEFRLSGKHISKEFYGDEISTFTHLPIPKLGTEQNSYTGRAYTHQEKFNDRTVLNGIDVSKYNGDIDWNKVKAAGIDFAFVQVGYRGYSAGSIGESTKDPYYETNMENANAAGVNVGIYVFSQAITEAEGIEEANYILEHIGDYYVNMPLIIDYEYIEEGVGRLYNAKLSKEDATKVCLAFCDTIAAAGYTPMVYANKNMLENHLNPSDITSMGYRIWLANYTTNTSYSGEFDFWQYSSEGKVDGINGNVDMNFYYASPNDTFADIKSLTKDCVINPIPDQPYTGKNITPDTIITYDGTVLQKDKDYKITCTNNKNIGKATATIKGTGRYYGSTTLKFNIVPKNVSNFKAKKKDSDYITLSWSKNTSGSGYELYRSTAPNGTYKKLKKITSNKTTTFKNTKLKAGQCYYYKIRSYKKVGGTTYYGAFTPVKSIYTKMGYTRNATAKNGAAIYETTTVTETPLVTPAPEKLMPVTYYTKGDDGNGWYFVTYKADGTSYKGFIPANNVTITKVGKVTSSDINVRKSYSTSSKKLTTLKKNTKVTVLSSKKKSGVTWYKVTFKKKGKVYNGWISSQCLKLV